MGMFREAVACMGGFISMQPGMLVFLGLTATGFISSPAVGGTSQAPTPGNVDVLRRRISIWVCYMAMTMVCSVLFTFRVRVLVEGDACSLAWRHANEEMAVTKETKHGVAGIAGWKGKVVRPCFCLAIAFSFGSSVCAIALAYCYLKLQVAYVNGSPEITPFAVVGVISILVHGFLGWVAITQD